MAKALVTRLMLGVSFAEVSSQLRWRFWDAM